ncbi:unnamed protein product [Phytomonas sp. Hart1]|nr:unnamed protein product [Phytomonas sp. Hart1]|eukprot:CCW71286.1 unnamed protein product [Phytomonas sp. isolate Hart1]
MGSCCGTWHSASKSPVKNSNGNSQGRKASSSRAFRFSLLSKHVKKSKKDSGKLCSTNSDEFGHCNGTSACNAKTSNLEQFNNGVSSNELRRSSSIGSDSLVSFGQPSRSRAPRLLEEDSIDTFQVSYSTISPPNFDDTPTVNVSQPTQSGLMTDFSQRQQPWHSRNVSDLTSECDYTHNVELITPFSNRASASYREPEWQTANAEVNRKQRFIDFISTTPNAFLAHFYTERAMMTHAFILEHLELMIAILEKEEYLERNHIRTLCNIEFTILAHQIPSLTQMINTRKGIHQQLSLATSRDARQLVAIDPDSMEFSSSNLSCEENIPLRKGNFRVSQLERANSAPNGLRSLRNVITTGGATEEVGYHIKDRDIRRMATALPLGLRDLRQTTSFGSYDVRICQQCLSPNLQPVSALSSVRTLGWKNTNDSLSSA